MRRAIGKELKLTNGVSSGKLKEPPKSCIPKRANMRMKRKRRNKREMIERIELSREITRFLRDDQYLKERNSISDLTLNALKSKCKFK